MVFFQYAFKKNLSNSGIRNMKDKALKIAKIAALVFSFIMFAGFSAYITLTLIVKSEDTVIVPELTGKEIVYVLEILTDLGLNIKVKGSEYSADIPKNYVIFQQPESGTEIKKGRDVKIIISKGAKTIVMPNLNGLSVQQAHIIIEENGLCQGKHSSTYSHDIEKDNIIAQVPSPGALITRGDCVNVLVSLGLRPRVYKMPDLSGLSLDNAIEMIEKSNLLLGEVRFIFNEDKRKDAITDQEPLSGYPVFERSLVNLVVNKKKDRHAPGYLTGGKRGKFFRYRLENGFFKRHIRVCLTGLEFSNDLLDEFVKPGEEIWLLILGDNNAYIEVFEDDELVESWVID